MTFIRREVWSLEREQAWHPILHAYALAVAVMRSRADDDPTSWSYQAQVHDMTDPPDRFRGQCQHQTWYFLSWHRAYLHWFELMVRTVVAQLPADEVDAETRANWALPYWGYDLSSANRVLPPAFRATTLRDGATANPLRIPQRTAGINAGTTRISRTGASSAAALSQTVFTAPANGATSPGFGGAKTPANHFDESSLAVPGVLEIVPHGQVHNQVGQFMAAFDTAPLDPIFWLHHANIDRLWTRWIAAGGQNPTDTAWLDLAFDFHDEKGDQTTATARDVLDVVALGYEYDDAAPPDPLEAAVTPIERGDEPAGPAELVGVTSDRITLSGDTARAAVPVDVPSGPVAADAAGPRRIYLTVDDIRGPVSPSITYGVYLHAPDQDPATDDDFYVGPINFFGIEKTARTGTDHGGLRFSFDITGLYRRLREEGRWGGEMTVSFLPIGPEPVPVDERDDVGGDPDAADERADAERAASPVDVGRVGVYFR